jgi:hypothetical protein
MELHLEIEDRKRQDRGTNKPTSRPSPVRFVGEGKFGEDERRTKMKRGRTIPQTAMAALALLVGCATGSRGSNPFAESPRSEQEVRVFVTNLSFQDATVWSVINGGRRRLGRVSVSKEEVFTVPLNHPAEMYLEVDILAGPRCITETLIVDPGDHLELQVNLNNPYLICRES